MFVCFLISTKGVRWVAMEAGDKYLFCWLFNVKVSWQWIRWELRRFVREIKNSFIHVSREKPFPKLVVKIKIESQEISKSNFYIKLKLSSQVALYSEFILSFRANRFFNLKTKKSVETLSGLKLSMKNPQHSNKQTLAWVSVWKVSKKWILISFKPSSFN